MLYPGIAGGIHSGLAAKRIYDKAGVIGEAVKAGGVLYGAYLDSRFYISVQEGCCGHQHPDRTYVPDTGGADKSR